MDAIKSLRVVLIHDWLTGMRGGEKVLEHLCRRWPSAPLYTLIHKRGSCSRTIEDRPIVTSLLNKLPRVESYYRYTLPLMPWAVGWRLPACDLVFSSSHCVAKGVTVPAGALHLCYCHTPMRYAWHMQDSYFHDRGWGGPKKWLAKKVLARLREWDRRTAAGVTHFIANSEVVRQRIRDCYERDAVVIHPPADTNFYCPADVPREDYYLILSAFAPYKRLDLAIDACKKLGRKLVIIGSGQDEKKLRRFADDKIQFLGWQPDEVLRDHLRRCQALLFPGEEDFGIVPVEAQACGTPVIAFGRGGATETVIHGTTGLWFDEQTVDCLAAAIEQLECRRDTFDPRRLQTHALRFRAERFDEELFAFVANVMGLKKKMAA
ncbi:MAG: glycosyltransferase family 4 protein [Gemmataceae bacterium]|nr:glycosyltransferase family 4 protein [Gemmataceae bacterium]